MATQVSHVRRVVAPGDLVGVLLAVPQKLVLGDLVDEEVKEDASDDPLVE